MRKRLASPAIFCAVVASCLSLGILKAEAQTPPATPAPVSAPATPAVSPKAPRAGKAGSGQMNRKYERSYTQCKTRALRHGLRGAERRAYIRRCELGFAPPRAQPAPGAPSAVSPPAASGPAAPPMHK